MSAGRPLRHGLPGRLVLVVGPSGAGKDSLIRHARGHLADDPRFAFPRRVVTRPPSDAEDNIGVDAPQFAAMLARDAFAAAWTAHGLSYGIPAEIELDLAASRSVVCNVSRTVVQDLRERYANVFVIAVTAPPEILASRLAARRRAADGDVGERVRRSSDLSPAHADSIVTNADALEVACASFLSALAGEGAEKRSTCNFESVGVCDDAIRVRWAKVGRASHALAHVAVGGPATGSEARSQDLGRRGHGDDEHVGVALAQVLHHGSRHIADDRAASRKVEFDLGRDAVAQTVSRPGRRERVPRQHRGELRGVHADVVLRVGGRPRHHSAGKREAWIVREVPARMPDQAVLASAARPDDEDETARQAMAQRTPGAHAILDPAR